MNEKEIRQAVSEALNSVKKDDTDLLRYDVNERSITHQLAVYLGEEIDGEWDGDLGRVETWGGEPDEMYGDVSELLNGDGSM